MFDSDAPSYGHVCWDASGFGPSVYANFTEDEWGSVARVEGLKKLHIANLNLGFTNLQNVDEWLPLDQ